MPLRALLMLLLTAFQAAGQPVVLTRRAPSENEVKAAFLLNFTKFIEWPVIDGAADGNFNICIWGEDPFGPVLEQTLQNEKVNGHPLVIQRLGRNSPKACRILYIERNEKDVKELLGTLGPGVLTVGEGENFLKEGGMIAFVLENHRVRFSINRQATRNAALILSSRLLAVARSVER
jgi:hypothetical protein